MDEQKTDTQTKPETPTTNSNLGASGVNIVDEAKKIRDEIRAENDRREAILKQEQNLHAERMLAGTAGGHVASPQISEEELKKKQAMEYWKGTGVDDAISKYNE